MPTPVIEGITHFGFADQNIFVLRRNHAFDGFFDILDRFVNDAVEANVYAAALCHNLGFAVRTDVESDDDCFGRLRKHDVRFRNGTSRRMNDRNFDFVARKFQKLL